MAMVGMKKLYIMRHAKAVEGIRDKARPLSKAGHKQVARLREKEFGLFNSLDLILCSPAMRTRETLDGFMECLSEEVVIRYIKNLYGAPADTLLRELALIEDHFNYVMIIGHNPEVTDFVLNVCEYQHVVLDKSMPKGGIAEFSLKQDFWYGLTYKDLTFTQLIEP